MTPRDLMAIFVFCMAVGILMMICAAFKLPRPSNTVPADRKSRRRIRRGKHRTR